MANTTYALIATWLPDIIEATEMYLVKKMFMPQIVQVWNNSTSDKPRRGDKYDAGTVATLSEGVDITTAQTITRTPFATITPAEVGDMFIVTDNRLESDNVDDIMSDAVEHIGNTMRLSVETALISDLTNLTGGSVGTAGGSLTWALLAAAESRLRSSGVDGPYNVVLHDFSWYDLAIQNDNTVPLVVEESLRNANDFYLGTFGMMRFYTTGVMGTGTAVVNAMFNPQALAYDIRRPLRIRLERNESLRATEIVFTHKYAHGVWRAEKGIKIVADASAP